MMSARRWLVSVAAIAVWLSCLPALRTDELERLSRRIESTREIPFPHRIEYRLINVGRTGAVPMKREELEKLIERCKLEESGDAFKVFCDGTCVHAKDYDLPWGSGTVTFDGSRVRVELETTTSGTQLRLKDVEVCDGRRTYRKNTRPDHVQVDVENVLRTVDPNDFRLVPRFSHLVRTTVEEHPGVIAVSGFWDKQQVEIFLDERSLLLREEWRTYEDDVSIVYQLGASDVAGVAFPKFLCHARFKNDQLSRITARVIDSVKKIDAPGPDLFKISAEKGDTIVDHTRKRADGSPIVFWARADTDDLAETLGL